MNDEYLIYGETLKSIADSIRSVSSVSTTWTPDEMAEYILANLVKPTSRQAAKTYTPSTSNQTIPAGTFLTGAATIQGDADWTEGNIKKGVNMWGKTGTLSGAWGDPSVFNGISKVISGSFTIANFNAANNVAYTISHGMGITPKIFIMLLGTGNAYNIGTTTSGKSGIGYLFYAQLTSAISGRSSVGYNEYGTIKNTYNDLQHSGIGSSISTQGVDISLTASTITIKPYKSGSTSVQFFYPVPYYWIALA